MCPATLLNSFSGNRLRVCVHVFLGYSMCKIMSSDNKDHFLFSNLDIFLKIILKFYLFLAMLGLHCCVDFSLVAASKGYSLVVVSRLLIAMASLGEEHGL